MSSNITYNITTDSDSIRIHNTTVNSVGISISVIIEIPFVNINVDSWLRYVYDDTHYKTEQFKFYYVNQSFAIRIDNNRIILETKCVIAITNCLVNYHTNYLVDNNLDNVHLLHDFFYENNGMYHISKKKPNYTHYPELSKEPCKKNCMKIESK